MSIITSKQAKQHQLVDVLFLCLALTLVLFLLIPSNWNMHNRGFFRIESGTLDSPRTGLTLHENVSFAADQRYWDANCRHGWSSDAGCEAIVLRTQFCTGNAPTGYCSQYQDYLRKQSRK